RASRRRDPPRGSEPPPAEKALDRPWRPDAHLTALLLPVVTVRKSSYRSIASLQRDIDRCRACAEAGYPLESLPARAPYAGQHAYMFGQAPGIVEGQERLPWRGRAGQTLRRWFEMDERSEEHTSEL